MEFQITARFNAENEAGMAAFLMFIKDNYAAEVHDASADSVKFICHATLVLTSLENSIAAIGAFKQAFDITYKLAINQ